MGILYNWGKKVDMQSLGRTIAWRKKTATEMANRAQQLMISGYRYSCPICECKESIDYVELHKTIYKQCSQCGHLYQFQIFHEENITARYKGESTYLSYMADDKYFQQRVNMLATPKVEYISTHIKNDKHSEWLDIGCGAGELLLAAQKLGWKVRGIEASNIGVAQGKRLGFRVDQQYITPHNASDLIGNSFLISIMDVLEHLADPLAILKIISEYAQACEYIVVEVPRHPSLSALSAKLFPDSVVRHLIIPGHIHIFTEKSVEILLDKCGFEITHCWKFGQDFYEIMSMLTQQAHKEIGVWPIELFNAINDVQFVLDKYNLSDSMLLISKRKQKN